MENSLNMTFTFSILTFLTSLIITWLLLKENFLKKKYVLDQKNDLARKIHVGNIKRIGGLAIVFTLFFFLFFNYYFNNDVINFKILVIFLFSMLFFLIGFLEDLIKNIHPFIRLSTLLIISLLCLIQTENLILKTNIDILDQILTIKVISIFITAVCMVASANSFNMMDGSNGLITIFTAIIILIVGIYAYSEGNMQIVTSTSIFFGALMGFLFFNWPKAYIFLGDGGSYLIGSFLFLLLIFSGNTLEKFGFLNVAILMVYPFWEIFFTVLRRLKIRNTIISADNYHLHSLIYILLNNYNFFKRNPTVKNAVTSVCINLIALSGPILFLLLNYNKDLDDKNTLSFFLIFLLIYTIIYILVAQINKSCEQNK
jgi:UDP-GlcNAc:undecaprenyl-phosphate/decaprenyl-phosphate GlcNAc-1-phosphate transferase